MGDQFPKQGPFAGFRVGGREYARGGHSLAHMAQSRPPVCFSFWQPFLVEVPKGDHFFFLGLVI